MRALASKLWPVLDIHPQPESLFQVLSPPPQGQLLLLVDDPRPGGRDAFPAIGHAQIAQADVPDRDGKLGSIGEPYAGGKVEAGGQLEDGSSLLFGVEDFGEETARMLIE